MKLNLLLPTRTEHDIDPVAAVRLDAGGAGGGGRRAAFRGGAAAVLGPGGGEFPLPLPTAEPRHG